MSDYDYDSSINKFRRMILRELAEVESMPFRDLQVAVAGQLCYDYSTGFVQDNFDDSMSAFAFRIAADDLFVDGLVERDPDNVSFVRIPVLNRLAAVSGTTEQKEGSNG